MSGSVSGAYTIFLAGWKVQYSSAYGTLMWKCADGSCGPAFGEAGPLDLWLKQYVISE